MSVAAVAPTQAAEDEVLYEVADHVATLTLNAPGRMNTISGPMLDELTRLLVKAGEDRDVRVIVLTGTGRAFCAGLDMASMASGGSGLSIGERTHGDANIVQQVSWGWRTLPMPVIAAGHYSSHRVTPSGQSQNITYHEVTQ